MAFINLYQNSTRDARIQLALEEMLLPMPWGNNWVRLRIGVRYLIPVAQPVNIQLGDFPVGVVNHDSGYSLASCTGWLGLDFLNDGNNPLTYVAVANNPGYWTAPYLRYGFKVGASATMTNVNTTGPYTAATRYPVHGAALLDITRPSYLSVGAYSMQPRSTAPASASSDLTYAGFIEACRNYSTPGAYFSTPSIISSITTYTGTTNLDAVSVYWNRSLPVLEISDVVALRIM